MAPKSNVLSSPSLKICRFFYQVNLTSNFGRNQQEVVLLRGPVELLPGRNKFWDAGVFKALKSQRTGAKSGFGCEQEMEKSLLRCCRSTGKAFGNPGDASLTPKRDIKSTNQRWFPLKRWQMFRLACRSDVHLVLKGLWMWEHSGSCDSPPAVSVAVRGQSKVALTTSCFLSPRLCPH